MGVALTRLPATPVIQCFYKKKLNSDAFSIRILEERSCMTCLAQCTYVERQ